MFRYVLAILLITCYAGLGNSAQISSKQISTSFLNLKNDCGNVFLAKQLNNTLKDCTVFAPPYKTKQVQCLMFYDMSVQLCKAIKASGLTLNEDINKINEEADVNSLCETTKDWLFTELQEYPDYKDINEKIFKHPGSCGQICGSGDPINDDTNFYCKFFKWGWEVLKTHLNATSQTKTNIDPVVQSLLNPPVNTNNSVTLVSSTNDSQDILINNTTFNDKVKVTEPHTTLKTVENDDTKQNIPAVTTTTKGTTHQIAINIEKTEQTQDNEIKVEKPSSLPEIMNNVNNKNPVDNKNAGLPLSKNNEDDSKTKLDVKDSEHFGDEDFNSEDDKDGTDDVQGDDDNVGDPMTGDNIEPPAVVKSKTNSEIEDVAPSNNKDIQRDSFSGNAQDVSVDDDDHFFTFFLTAVILVVLLYILYHDKSKISKLFFGLLVEGRQGGRRRNSRGHAYRRLDTLEQAMSTNTDAPPSKIIY